MGRICDQGFAEVSGVCANSGFSVKLVKFVFQMRESTASQRSTNQSAFADVCGRASDFSRRTLILTSINKEIEGLKDQLRKNSSRWLGGMRRVRRNWETWRTVVRMTSWHQKTSIIVVSVIKFETGAQRAFAAKLAIKI